MLRWIPYLAAALLCACSAEKRAEKKAAKEASEEWAREVEGILNEAGPDIQDWLVFSAARNHLLDLRTAPQDYLAKAEQAEDPGIRKDLEERAALLQAELPKVEAIYAEWKAKLVKELDEDQKELLEAEIALEVEMHAMMSKPETPREERRAKQQAMKELRAKLSPDLIGVSSGIKEIRATYMAAERAGVLENGNGGPRKWKTATP